jgi:hypothetical protein
MLVASEDFYRSVIRHSHDSIDQSAFHLLVRVRIADRRHHGWVQVHGMAIQDNATEIPSYPQLSRTSSKTALQLVRPNS